MRKLIFLCPSVCRSLRATCLFCRWSYEERLVFLMWLTAAQPRTSKTKERLMHPIIHLHCWSQIWGRAIAKTLSEKYQTHTDCTTQTQDLIWFFSDISPLWQMPTDWGWLVSQRCSVTTHEILLFRMLPEQQYATICIVKCVIKIIETCIFFFRQHFQ